MSNTASKTSCVSAPTLFQKTALETYGYRRFGGGSAPPLLCLQHFTGTLDYWDPALMDQLASKREVILFDSAGIGRSTGGVPDSIEGMATHALAFAAALNLGELDILGFSLGGMVAQAMALQKKAPIRKLALVGTAPEGGDEIMRMDKPSLVQIMSDPRYRGLQVLAGLFFTQSESGQAAGRQFVDRLMLRQSDREPIAGQDVVMAQIGAFRKWEDNKAARFASLHEISQPSLVVNGVHDMLIPVRNSYLLAEHLPNAVLMTFPDAGHGALYQYRDAFARLLAEFLDGNMLKI